ncbi:integral membrane protein [Companilactobacillus mindensis DSM 14500]|uniref:Integral membrane protein n=1 Tax=Companilactobacillus mindensis DSM 14500 TaxID=1423770 RepID=A0A0R1QSE0_9LACO|nr:YitT family protein [Companilactobacillus mindensis]KRL45322.1 integral membrane protein [Companilactobacillus mindensis DSM 14500]
MKNKKRLSAKLLIMLVALELIAFSLNMFFEPHSIAAGGATGIAILLQAGWKIPTFISVLVINIVMLVLAYIHLDRQTTLKLALGSFMLPILLYITPVYNLIPNNKLISIIVGSVIFGIGLAILYTLNMSSGGTTVPPMIIHQNFGIDKYISLFIIDAIVCLGNFVVADAISFLLAVMSVGISSLAIKGFGFVHTKRHPVTQ